jgi:predicted porin
MNKKLMALAVAGALAAPAAALAQTTIYGTLKAEWGIASQPNTTATATRHDAESLNSGASNIGFRGEEKLGGTMAVWYQCESDLQFLGGKATTIGNICDRNSALGLKGGFGNFYVGTWDSPIKRASGVTRITEETGWTGSQHITLSSAAGPKGFSNRYTQTFNYDTPNMGGFSLSAQFTTLGATRDALSTTVAEGRVIGLGGQYATGPLAVVAAYEKDDENRATGSTPSSEDTAWLIGVSYVLGPVKLGFTYTSMETDNGTGTKVERPAWNLAGQWQLGGPHSIKFGYAVADDRETNGVKAADSGAVQYQISYWNALSKRTDFYVAYVKLDNDNAGTYNLTGLAAGAGSVFPGDSADVIGVGLFHKF